MKKSLIGLCALAATLMVPFAASASSLESWTFYTIGSDGQVLSSPQIAVSSPGGYNITLTAIGNYTTDPMTAGQFYDRNLGNSTDEQGLGVVPTDEVNGTEAIKINLPSGSGLTDFHLLFKSLSGGELADIWAGGPSAALGGTLLGSITHDTGHSVAIPESFAIGNAYIGSDIYVTAQTADFLLYGANATNPVPEPVTMALFGAGLVSLVGSRLRKKGLKFPE